MRIVNQPIIRVLVLLLLTSLVSADVNAQVAEIDKRAIAFFPAYSIYDGYLITEVPVEILTHMYYGPIGVSENGQCASTDEWADSGFSYPGDPIDSDDDERGNFNQFAGLRERNPDLKIIMSIGGWEHSSDFSEIAADEEARVRFSQSCIAYMREYGFDGIDIDWRYPIDGGMEPGREDDIDNYALLLADFRGQVEYWTERDVKPYSLSITGPAASELLDNFRVDLLQDQIDWVVVTTFGFYGFWSDITGHLSPLYGNPLDPRGAEVAIENSFAGAVEAYLDYGVPAEKIVPAFGLFGQAWQNVRAGDLFGLYELNAGTPLGTRDNGLLYYRDLMQVVTDPNYVEFYDDVAQAAWLYNADRRIAISYENIESVRTKLVFILDKGLGGVYLWQTAFDTDDHSITTLIVESLLPRREGQP